MVEEVKRGEEIDAAVFAAGGYLSLPTTGIRSLFDVPEALWSSLITRGGTRRAV